MSINPRKYRHRVTIQQLNPNADVDVNGAVDKGNDDNWIRFADRRAAVFNRGGREVYRAQQVQANATNVVTMPFDSTAAQATTEMRIRHNGTKLNIVSGPTDITDDRRELQFICEESQ